MVPHSHPQSPSAVRCSRQTGWQSKRQSASKQAIVPVRIRSQRQTEGPVRLGFQFEETAKLEPWKLQAVCTLTNLKLNERFAFEAKSSGPQDKGGRFDL